MPRVGPLSGRSGAFCEGMMTEGDAIERAIEDYETRIHPDAAVPCHLSTESQSCNGPGQLIGPGGRRYCWAHAFAQFGWYERKPGDLTPTPSTGLEVVCSLCGRHGIDRGDANRDQRMIPRQFSRPGSRTRYVCWACNDRIDLAYEALGEARRRERPA